MLRTQSEERRQPLPGRAPAEALQQKLLVGARIDDRRVADGIRAAGDPGVDLAQRDLVADEDRGFETGAAGALQIHAGGLRIQTRWTARTRASGCNPCVCLMTAPAATSPRRTPCSLKRSTTPRNAAVSMSWLLAFA